MLEKFASVILRGCEFSLFMMVVVCHSAGCTFIYQLQYLPLYVWYLCVYTVINTVLKESPPNLYACKHVFCLAMSDQPTGQWEDKLNIQSNCIQYISLCDYGSARSCASARAPVALCLSVFLSLGMSELCCSSSLKTEIALSSFLITIRTSAEWSEMMEKVCGLVSTTVQGSDTSF